MGTMQMSVLRLKLMQIRQYQISALCSLQPAEIPMLSVQCVCHTTIQQHSITCNISDQTLQGGTVWINASLAEEESNSTTTLRLTIATCNTRTRYQSRHPQHLNHSGIPCSDLVTDTLGL